MSYFLNTSAYIIGNNKLRDIQVEAYISIKEYFDEHPTGEALAVLPTGSGKTGLVSIAPFGICKGRVLIITPGLVTADSILKNQESLRDNFWMNHGVILDLRRQPKMTPYVDGVTLRDMEQNHIIVSNIQRCVSTKGILSQVPNDFFDMIIVDEAHHAAANSWKEVLDYFPAAKKLHVTGTPYRGDDLELPGERIFEKSLAEVMRIKLVKWLAKSTVNNNELFFISPKKPDIKLSIHEVEDLHDRQWIERSIALSEACSKDVINKTIEHLKDLRTYSPNIPHKIIAAACSIEHAQDVTKWYAESGLRTILIHSKLSNNEKKLAFKSIEQNRCDVVVNVDMLKEGYDHKYLTILGIFRPYKSKNAFAQVIGRVLRVIQDEDSTNFEIDNYAKVIFHEELGLNALWKEFEQEVEKAKTQVSYKDEIVISAQDYRNKAAIFAKVVAGDRVDQSEISYIADIDFQELYDQKIKIISEDNQNLTKVLEEQGIDKATIEAMINTANNKKKDIFLEEIDALQRELRPAQFKKQIRKIINEQIESSIAELLVITGHDPKGSEFQELFNNISALYYALKNKPANDGVLVIWMRAKLKKKYGKIEELDNESLAAYKKDVPELINELRGIIK
ncbi:MAG: DEAD/DEAH box helicase family protein [Colwellia sp.]|nr:DEAD/DEAH box helicase family protein [Colwellia sp.]